MTRSPGPIWRAWTAVPLLALALSLPACSHWRESYLNGATRTVSQENIIDRLGEPWKKKSSILNGQTTWIYRYALTENELDPTGVNALGRSMRQATDTLGALIGGRSQEQKNRPKCFHYLLTFDRANVLKHWRREACATTSL